MQTATLELCIQLPAMSAIVKVCPPDLAPWTPAFWRPLRLTTKTNFDETLPLINITMEQRENDVVITTPAGHQSCSIGECEPLWDVLQRNLLREGCGPGLLHAATVQRNSQTWLIVGKSGAGKSTLINRLVDRGWRYGSDEYVQINGNKLKAVPRGLEWASTEAPADLEVQWRYKHYASNSVFGHRRGLLDLDQVELSDVAGAIALSRDHSAKELKNSTATFEPSRHWLNEPDRAQQSVVKVLTKLPCYVVTGSPDTIADYVESIG